MKKPDDDLKINISEIFGGDLPSPSDSIDENEPKPQEAPLETQKQTVAESETQFQEWMKIRNAELEAKSQELERRLQEIKEQTEQKVQVEEIPPTQSETAAEIPTAQPPPIDFDAPIAPPFMGNPTAVEPSPVPGNKNPYEGMTVSAEIDSQKEAELKKLQSDHEFLMLYDEFRNIIAHELKDLVGEKKTFTMLGRTVELARTKYPEIFRNANWDASGNLLEDGSMESQRVIENKNLLDPLKADLILDTALSSLLNLRMQAVEKGLGTGLKNKVRARMSQWITEKIQKAEREGKDISILRRLNGYAAQI